MSRLNSYLTGVDSLTDGTIRQGHAKHLCNWSCCLATVVILSVTSTWAQRPQTLTENSFERALEVLDRGTQALGGLKNFEAIEDISFRFSAKIPELGQSSNPDAALYIRPLAGEGVIDIRGKRAYRREKTNFLGSADFITTVVTTVESGFTADLTCNAVFPFAAPAIDSNNKAVQRILPHQLVQLAFGRLSTLRWLGERDYDGQKQDVITFADSDGNQITLYFDSRTGLLTKSESLGDRIIQGLGSAETIFSDYRSVNEIKVPFRVVSKFGGELVQDLTYTDVQFNTHPNASVFESPSGAEVGPEVGGPPQPLTLTKIASDVYYVNAVNTGSIFFYSAMFVVFKDYVLVIEAPIGDGLSRSIMTKIKETAPGKPIRYLVATHYHIDHLAGVRAYLAAGTTVVTTPGNVKFIDNLASVVHPLNSKPLTYQRPLPIESFKGKRVFSDGEQVVELYDIGPTPHVDEMVIAYLPREKLVFVSDLFPVNFKGHIRVGDPTTELFEQKLRQLGLRVERIASGHGRIGTIDDLRRAAGVITVPQQGTQMPSPAPDHPH
jgi:glyoxylase-like metal-dependent hydrolase (beta-lactamase superfamily II)